MNLADRPPPIHSLVDRGDNTTWYRGTDGLWFCITDNHNEEHVRWGQLTYGHNVTIVRSGP